MKKLSEKADGKIHEDSSQIWDLVVKFNRESRGHEETSVRFVKNTHV